MKRVLLLLHILAFLLVYPAAAQEVKPLSKALIESFLSVTKEIGGLGQTYPELSNYSGGFDAENQLKVIKFLQESKAYPEIQRILKTSDFSDLEEIFALSQRILTIGYFSRLNNVEGVSLFQTEKMLQVNLNNLRANNASDEIITKAEKTLNYIKDQVKLAEQKLSSISEEDKAFVLQNNEWLKQKFSSR